MDVLKCAAFLTAVEHGSIFAASSKLNYTPSGVNRMIRALEDELNVTLLVRSRSGVKMTEIGECVFPAIKQFVEYSDQIYEICKEERKYVHETITVGAYHNITEYKLPMILNKFKLQYPGVQINVVEGPHTMLLPMLKENDLDCCILCNTSDADVSFEPLYTEQIVVLLSAKQMAAARESFPVADLGRYPFICFGDKPVELESVLDQNRIKLDIRFTTRSIHTVYKMVEQGLGISAGIDSSLFIKNGNVIALPLDQPAQIDIGLVLSKDKVRPVVRRFENLVISTLSTEEAE